MNKSQTIEYLKSFGGFVGSKIYTNENVDAVTKEKESYKIVTSKRVIRSDIVIVASCAFGNS